MDGKNVVRDYSEHEKNIAIWLENTFGGEIYMIPRVNIPEGISTPDYIWSNEKWDLKSISGNSVQTIYHSIRKSSRQSHNFILEIINNKLSLKKAIEQVNELYRRTDLSFIDKII